jgi:O-antigen/teichoic acid export membrane protein
MGLSIITTLYIARSLGPQNFGELSYVQSIVGILALFAALTGTLYRDIVRNPEKEPSLLGTAWAVSFGGVLITITLTLGFILSIPHEQLTATIAVILCFAQFFSPFSIIQNVFYAKTETKWLAITNVSIRTFVSILKVAAIISGKGVLILAVLMAVEQIIMAVTYIWLYVFLHKGSIFRWNFDLLYMKQLVTDSIPVVAIAFSGAISARVDQIFIKHFLDTATVGLYSVAVQLSEVWQLLPGIVMTAVLPAIVNAKITNAAAYRVRLGTLGVTFLIYGVLVSIFMTIFGSLIINTLYGTAFAGSIQILQVYIWALPGLVLGLFLTSFLIAENLRRIQIVSAVLPMLLNIILNIVLIPDFGALGAAWATVISYSMSPFICLCYKNVRSIFFPRVIIK